MGQNQLEMFAPFSNQERRTNGATVAPFQSGAPKENGAGANVRQSRATVGARPAHPFSHRGAPNGARRKELQAALIELSAIRDELQPAMDCYNAATANARNDLAEHQERFGHKPDADEKANRIAMHDRITQACERWGKQAVAWREANRMAKAYAKELKQLSEGNKRG